MDIDSFIVYIKTEDICKDIAKDVESTILVIIVWNFTIFQYRSDSPQVKQNLMSSIANFVYELLHELPNTLRLRILENQEILKKYLGWTQSLVPSLLSRTQTLPIAVKKHAKADIKLFFSYPILLNYSILFQIFCPGLQI